MRDSASGDLLGHLADLSRQGHARLYLEEKIGPDWVLRYGGPSEAVADFLRSCTAEGPLRVRPAASEDRPH